MRGMLAPWITPSRKPAPGRGLGFVGDWLLGSCTRGLVAGHYQPLADNHGVAPQPDQTRSLQSDQRTLGRPQGRLPGALTGKGSKRIALRVPLFYSFTSVPPWRRHLRA